MPSLLETQRALHGALLQSEDAALLDVLAPDAIAADRIEIHRTNVIESLSAALVETFPVVRRLVDERFFGFAAHEFICDCPPVDSRVAEFGGEFADFLSAFPPCRELVYLADVARLEWRIDRAARAVGCVLLDAARLAAVDADAAAALAFVVQPSYGYVASPWPIDRIWRINQPDAPDETVDLALGGARLEVRRKDGMVEFRALPEPAFAFREALAAGRTLGDATEAALAVDSDFDAAAAFGALFAEGALVGVMT